MPARWRNTKRVILGSLSAAMLTALIGVFPVRVAAEQRSPTWSVFVHIEYPNGFVYEHAFATGVATSDVPAMLEACASAHAYGSGSVIHYHCFPAPE
jgi:hypothetical protein